MSPAAVSPAAFGAVQALPLPTPAVVGPQRCHRRGVVVALRRGIVRTRAIPAPDDDDDEQRGAAAEVPRKAGKKVAEVSRQPGEDTELELKDERQPAAVGVGLAETTDQSAEAGNQRTKARRKSRKAAEKGSEAAMDSVVVDLHRGDSARRDTDALDSFAYEADAKSSRRADVASSVGGGGMSGDNTDSKHRETGDGGAGSLSGAELKENQPSELMKIIPVRRTGFNSPVVMTRELAKLLKTSERVMTRPQVASLVAEYVSAKKLGCADDGRFFLPNPALKRLFPEETGRVQISKLVSYIGPHVVSPSECGDTALEERAAVQWDEYVMSIPLSRRIRKVDRRGRLPPDFQDKMRASGRGLFTPCELSPALSKICDGASVLSRPEVTKCVWRHIKTLGLQDAKERRIVHTDPLLKEVCGGSLESVDCFELSKYVSRNMSMTA